MPSTMDQRFPTPTEIALRSEIATLRAKLLMYEWNDKRLSASLRPEPVALTMPDLTETITLHKSVALTANISSWGRLSVQVDASTGNGNHLIARYTADCYKFSRPEAADMAANLHENFLHNLANALSEGGFE